MSDYQAKLKRPEWLLKRLEILELARFTCEKCGVAGGDLQVHHRRYLPGREPWQYDYEDLACLCVRCHRDVTEVQSADAIAARYPADADTRATVRVIVGALAVGMRFFPEPPPKAADFDAGDAWDFCRRLPDPRVRRPLMEFARWLWNTGTKDMPTVIAILEDRCRKNPDNPYAYYAPGGAARDCRSARVAIDAGERESAAHKAAERAFLGQKPR